MDGSDGLERHAWGLHGFSLRPSLASNALVQPHLAPSDPYTLLFTVNRAEASPCTMRFAPITRGDTPDFQ